MDKTQYYEIDILKLIKAMWHRLWAIMLVALLSGGAAFAYAAYWVAPIYEAEALMYVNNSSFSLGSTSFSISNSELDAAQNLVDTYIVILKTRTTLEAVIEDAELDYTFKQLKSRISSSPVNGTEIFSIKVASTEPWEAEKIANSIAKILPDRISDVVDGSSVRVVDYAVIPSEKVSPSITKYTAVGLIIGFIIACAVIVIRELLDTQIYTEEYLIKEYNLPVLAAIPNLLHTNNRANYYNSYEQKEEKGGGEKNAQNEKEA